MRAVVKYGRQPGNVAVQEVAEPAISPDQVLVEVGAVGVCGSDIHLWHENQSWTIQCPVILGHELEYRVLGLVYPLSTEGQGEPAPPEWGAGVEVVRGDLTREAPGAEGSSPPQTPDPGAGSASGGGGAAPSPKPEA